MKEARSQGRTERQIVKAADAAIGLTEKQRSEMASAQRLLAKMRADVDKEFLMILEESGDEHDKSHRLWILFYSRQTAIHESVVDEATAEEAAKRLPALSLLLSEAKKLAKKLDPPSAERQAELNKKYVPTLTELDRYSKTQLERLAFKPYNMKLYIAYFQIMADQPMADQDGEFARAMLEGLRQAVGEGEDRPETRPEVDPKTLAAAQIKSLDRALNLYKLQNGTYPSTEEGLKALVQKPADEDRAKTWGGPYLKTLAYDPWGNAYAYEFPGTRGGDGTEPNVWSRGPDGKDNTDDDIKNWQSTPTP